MKVLQIYNEHRSRVSGERAVVEATVRILAQNGHEPRLVMKSSRVLENSIVKRMNAFWGGVYNIRSYYEMRRLLKKDKPAVVHVHGVFPMFSPSVLVACRREGVPVVMTVHNHNLTCPTWYHLYKGRVCEVCVGGHEYRCVLKNCRNNILESAAYALRSGVARRFRLFHDNVSVLIALTPFARGKLLRSGFREDQIVVIPNPLSVKEVRANSCAGKYVAFAGRLSPEKGLDTLLAAAAQVPCIPFKVAGDGPLLSEVRARVPSNVEFLGRLGPDELSGFYEGSRLVIVPSIWFEQFPMVVLEAMSRGLPVLASRIGGLPGIVEEGVTGSLFEAGNPAALAQEVRRLWEDPLLCRRMGTAGQQKASREYTEEAYFENLMAAYQMAIQRSLEDAAVTPLVQINAAESLVPSSSVGVLKKGL